MAIAKPDGYTLRACIAHQYDLLPAAQKKAATWFLAEGGNHLGCSLNDVVERANVSPTAVIRMCQALGLPGYREFRLRWALEESNRRSASSSTATATREDSSADDSSAFTAIHMAIQETEELLDLRNVQDAARIVSAAKRVLIYGSGSSGLVARLASVSFSWAGLRSSVISDTQLRAEPESSDCDEQTAVLVISHRGFWPEVRTRLANDRNSGAKVIVITSAPHSELASHADCLLVTGCPCPPCEDNRLLALSAARVAQTAAIYVLVDAIRRLKSDYGKGE